MTNVRSFVTNLGWLATGETISKVFTLVAFGYLARVLGPGSFGNVEFAFAVTFIFSLVIDFGLGIYGAREISKEGGLSSSITQRVVVSRCWLAVLALGMLGLFVSTIAKPPEVRRLLLLFGLTLVPTPLLLQWVFQGRDWMRYVSYAQIARQGTFAVVVLALVRGETQTWIVAIAELAAVTACAGFNLLVYRHRLGAVGLQRFAWPDRRLIVESIPICLSQFMWAVKFFFATVLLGVWARPEEVGWFGAALRIVVALHTFVNVYFYNLLPAVSRCVTQPVQALRALLDGSIRASTWIALLGCTIGTIAAALAMRLIYGPSYEASTVPFQLLLCMLAVVLFSAHYRCTLIGYGRQGLELVSTSIGAGFNVLLIVLLYPRFGLAGAASAMLAAEVVTAVLAHYFVNRGIATIGAWPLLRGPAIVALALTLGMSLMAADPLWLKMCAALAIFAIGVCLLDPQMIRGIRRFVTLWPVSEGGATP